MMRRIRSVVVVAIAAVVLSAPVLVLFPSDAHGFAWRVLSTEDKLRSIIYVGALDSCLTTDVLNDSVSVETDWSDLLKEGDQGKTKKAEVGLLGLIPGAGRNSVSYSGWSGTTYDDSTLVAYCKDIVRDFLSYYRNVGEVSSWWNDGKISRSFLEAVGYTPAPGDNGTKYICSYQILDADGRTPGPRLRVDEGRIYNSSSSSFSGSYRHGQGTNYPGNEQYMFSIPVADGHPMRGAYEFAVNSGVGSDADWICKLFFMEEVHPNFREGALGELPFMLLSPGSPMPETASAEIAPNTGNTGVANTYNRGAVSGAAVRDYMVNGVLGTTSAPLIFQDNNMTFYAAARILFGPHPSSLVSGGICNATLYEVPAGEDASWLYNTQGAEEKFSTSMNHTLVSGKTNTITIQPSGGEAKTYVVDLTDSPRTTDYHWRDGWSERDTSGTYGVLVMPKQSRLSCSQIAGWLNSAYSSSNDLAQQGVSLLKIIPLNEDGSSPVGDNDGGNDPGGGGNNTPVANTCNIGAIGWIVCPVLNALGGMAEGIYGWIETNFLQIKTYWMKTDGGTHNAWKIFRDLANAAFVIMFLLVIISQITSIGISNYGVKKVLPKLIIGAVLINISYIICQIAVDLSNIFGSQLYSFLVSMAPPAEMLRFTDPAGDGSGAAGVAGGIIGAVLLITVVGAMAWANLGALALMLIAVIVSALTIFVLLTLRQAAVVLLVAISPLAFVCYMLPNTKSLFDKWLTMLKAMLLLYPICGLVMGAGYLASAILQSSTNATMDGGTSGLDAEVLDGDYASDPDKKSWIMQIVASSLRFLPMLAIPGLLKGSMNAVGNIGAKINGVSGQLRGSAQDKFKGSRAGMAASMHDRNVANTKAQIRGGQHKDTYDGRNPLRRLRKNVNNLRSLANKGINDRTGKAGNRYAAAGVAAVGKAEAEDMEMFDRLYQGKSGDAMEEILTNAIGRGDVAAQKSAINNMLKAGHHDQLNNAFNSDAMRGASQETRTAVARALRESPETKKEAYHLSRYAKKLDEGYTGDLDSFIATGRAYENITDEQLATQDAASLDIVLSHDQNAINDEQMARVLTTKEGSMKTNAFDTVLNHATRNTGSSASVARTMSSEQLASMSDKVSTAMMPGIDEARKEEDANGVLTARAESVQNAIDTAMNNPQIQARMSGRTREQFNDNRARFMPPTGPPAP